MADRTVGGRSKCRRVTVALALLAVTTAPAVAQDAPTAPASAPVPPGSDAFTSGGQPLAVVDGQLLTVAPFAGGLTLAVKVGTSGSRIRGTTATATSGTLDLGLLGDLALLAVSNAPTLARLGIDTSGVPAFVPLPRPKTADSRGIPEIDNRVALDAVRVGPAVVGVGHEMARAPDGGPAGSRTELADLRIDLGLAELLVAGGVAETSATPAEVTGSIAVGELSVRVAGTPLVALKGLEWTARQALGTEPQGGFSVGTATVAGVPIAAPGLDTLEALASQINAALAPAGVTLQLPTLTAQGLSPLSLVLKDSPAAFDYINPIYSLALAEAINQIEAALVGGVPETGLAVTVANVLLAALTGRGGARVDIGGLTTSVGVTPSETFSYGSGPTGSAPPSMPSGAPPGPSGPARSGSASAAPPAPSTPPVEPSGPAAGGRDLAQTVSSVVAEDLPAALVLAIGGIAIVGAWLVDRRRIADWAAQR